MAAPGGGLVGGGRRAGGRMVLRWLPSTKTNDKDGERETEGNHGSGVSKRW